MPECEIFDCFDFCYLYTMSIWVGDFGANINKFFFIFLGSFRGEKFPSCMLTVSLILRTGLFEFGFKKFG